MVVGYLSLSGIRSLQGILLFILLCNILFFISIYSTEWQMSPPPPTSSSPAPEDRHTNPVLSRQILFVGGVPRSGTTLARSMLDAHPDVHCGEETRVIPAVLGLLSKWSRSPIERTRLDEAGIGVELVERATAAFISEIILGHGPPAKFLCNKDPLVLGYMSDVVRMFPKSKFVLMIRDGRAVAYSIVSRKVTISGVNISSYLDSAKFWNKTIARMIIQCLEFGEDRCLPVYYEHLVQDPRTWMEKILAFGGIPWHEGVLHHHELIDKEVFLSRTEMSTSQVKEPVNTDAINKWQTKIPLETLRTIYKECDMLEKLGYQPV